eukprot:Amastigsp_a174552_42.p2 type:complete len:244 gc:universal Amastigsp_a174552_42:220-951(+)
MRERERVDRGTMRGKRLDGLAGANVPHRDGRVVRARGEVAAVGREGQGADATFVPNKDADALARLNVPQTRGAVAGAGGDIVPVGVEANAVNVREMPDADPQRRGVRRRKDACGRVVRRGGKVSPKRRRVDVPDGERVRCVRDQARPRLERPEPHDAVGRAGEHVAAVRGDRRRKHRARVADKAQPRRGHGRQLGVVRGKAVTFEIAHCESRVLKARSHQRAVRREAQRRELVVGVEPRVDAH